MSTTTATFTHDALVVGGTFACSGCLRGDERTASGAEVADRHDLRGSLAPVTACCGERVRYSSEHGAHVVWSD